MNWCPKCKSDRVMARALMYRVSYECVECGHTWMSAKQEVVG